METGIETETETEIETDEVYDMYDSC